MGRSYEQLDLEERCAIARLREGGQSIRQIAAALDRSPSSISRELKRNTGTGPRAAPYKPAYANEQAQARRWSGSRLERQDELRQTVVSQLLQGWSPEQVAGRMRRQAGRTVIGVETIYRFVYAQQRRTNDGAWRFLLPRAKGRRGRHGMKGGSPTRFIKNRVPLSQRDPAALDRRQAGHFEADYMLFSKYGQSILVLHERTSRLTLIARTQTRKAEPTADHLAELLRPLPKRLKRSLTFDNGTEFAEHYRLGLPTYFCDTHAPWQKGGVENAIGRLRRWLPRRTDLDDLTPDDVLSAAIAYNHTPRRCLDFQTPAEVFRQVLHFKRESTSRPSPG